MQETPEPRSPHKGRWWKSLFVAWVGLSLIGALANAVGLGLPTGLGLPAVAVTWILIWTIWRRTPPRPDSADAVGVIAAAQRILASFCAAIVLIGVAVLTLDSKGGLHRRDGVSIEVVVLGVALVGVLSLVGERLWVPRLDASDRDSVLRSWRSRFFARTAWAEAPALVAFGGFLLLGGEAWVYLVGLAASIAGFALASPSRGSVLRDQKQLDAAGEELDLLAMLGGWPGRWGK